MSERKRTPSVPHKNSEPFLPQLLASNTHQKPSDYILFDSNVSGNNLNLNSVNRMLDTKSSMNFMLKRQEGVLHRQEKELTELRASLKKPAKTPLWLSEDRLDSDSVTDYERKRQEESEDDEDVQRRHHHSHHHKSRMRHTSLRRHHRDRDFERQEESDSEDGRRVQEHRHRHLSVDRRR